MLTLSQLQKLEVVPSGAMTTNQCPIVVTVEDGTEPQRKAKKTIPTITADGAVINSCQGASGGRVITNFSFHNADTVNVTVTVRLNDNGTTRIIRKQTLATGEGLYWQQERGWYSLDVNGNIKTASAAADSAGISTALSTATVGSSQASSNASLSPASVSSQASSTASLSPASVSSQASSTAALTPASVSSQASSVAATNPATVSSLQSAASVQSFTSTTWSTASSTVSRVKSSFTW